MAIETKQLKIRYDGKKNSHLPVCILPVHPVTSTRSKAYAAQGYPEGNLWTYNAEEAAPAPLFEVTISIACS